MCTFLYCCVRKNPHCCFKHFRSIQMLKQMKRYDDLHKMSSISESCNLNHGPADALSLYHGKVHQYRVKYLFGYLTQ